MVQGVFLLAGLTSFAEKIPIFQKEETNAITRFFNDQNKKQDYWPEEHLRRWELKKVQPKGYENVDPHDSWFPIAFDADGYIASGELSQQYSYTHDYLVLQKATKIAVERLAKKMGWANETHLMGISLVQHQMEPGQIYNMRFHQDESRYTLVVLLNDETGWSGGDLQFRSLSYQWIQRTILHQQGHGILFANEGKQHAVTDMTPIADKITERTILTIHEKGLVDSVV